MKKMQRSAEERLFLMMLMLNVWGGILFKFFKRSISLLVDFLGLTWMTWRIFQPSCSFPSCTFWRTPNTTSPRCFSGASQEPGLCIRLCTPSNHCRSPPERCRSWSDWESPLTWQSKFCSTSGRQYIYYVHCHIRRKSLIKKNIFNQLKLLKLVYFS